MSETDSPKGHLFEAAYRGAASIALGAMSLLMVYPAVRAHAEFHGGVMYPRYAGPTGPDFADKVVHATLGGLLGIAVLVAMAGFAVVQGLRGLGAARRTGEPRILCHTGIFFGLLAVTVWVLLGFAMILSIDRIRW